MRKLYVEDMKSCKFPKNDKKNRTSDFSNFSDFKEVLTSANFVMKSY